MNSLGSSATIRFAILAALAWILSQALRATRRFLKRKPSDSGLRNSLLFLTQTLLRDAVPVLYGSAIFLSFQDVMIPEARRWARILFFGLIYFCGARLVTSLLKLALMRIGRRLHQPRARLGVLRGLYLFVEIVIWTSVILLFSLELGWNVRPVLEGVGIGGLVFVVLARGIINDFLAYFVVLNDKPFGIGDLIRVDEYKGRVERLGLNAVRIAREEGDVVSISNTQILRSAIQNLSRMRRRRAKFAIRLAHSESARVSEVLPLIKTTVNGTPGARMSRTGVTRIDTLGIGVETFFWVEGNDEEKYHRIQSEIFVALLKSLSDRGILLAAHRSSPESGPASGRPAA